MNRLPSLLNLFAVWVILLSFSPLANGALDMWVKIEGEDTKGESQDFDHKDWIDILAWSWSGANSGTTHQGAAGRAGRASINDLSFTKLADRSSPALLDALARGRRFPTVWLDVAKGGIDERVFERLALRDVIVTSVSMGGTSEDDRLTENITLNFAKIEKGYIATDPLTGRPGEIGTFVYDIVKNEPSFTNQFPVLNDGDRDGIDDIQDNDRDNNGIVDRLETLNIAPSPGRAGVTGFAWQDRDGDSSNDSVEPAARGTRVELYRTGQTRPVANRVVNENTGSYAFLNFPPGEYKVRFVPPVGFQFGAQTAQSSADPTTGFTANVTIIGGTNVVRSAAILSDDNAYSEFTFSDLVDGEDLSHFGDAGIIDDASTGQPILQITPDFPQVSGSSFYQEEVVAATFTTHFQFRMRGNGLQGEGFTFVVRDPDNRLFGSFLAGGGGGLGYAGMSDSFAVEFDTFPSGGDDPTQAHVGILENGNTSHPPGSSALTGSLGRINDGNVWNAWIEYDGSVLEVFLSSTPIKPGDPILTRAISFPSRRALVGFTAATFSATQAHEILSWEYEGGQNNSLVIEPATSQAELDAVTKAPGSIIIEGDPRSDLTMTNLTTVCGDLIIRNNVNLATINLPNLIEIFGDLIIENNDALAAVNVDVLREVAGNIRISTEATVSSDLREVQSENVTIAGVALENLMGKTGFGETKVQIDDAATAMELNIPKGAFTVPEVFEVDQITGAELDGLTAGAVNPEGSAVDVIPVLGFNYSFAGGGINLNREVEVQFEIRLNELPAQAKADLLAAYDAGEVTVFGRRSEDLPVEVFTVCDTLSFGVWENCAQGRALDDFGNVVPSEIATILEFTVFARHFSTYGVAVIEPLPVTQADLELAASQIAASFQVVPATDFEGDPIPNTFALSWTSYSVATAADGTHAHPSNRVETSTDLVTWTPVEQTRNLQILETVTNARAATLTVPDEDGDRFFRIGVGE